MGKAHVALIALLALGQSAQAEGPGQGQIGVRYLLEPEGMVITRVHPRMGAAAAGLKPGDLIVAIDGAELDGVSTKVGARVRGEIGSQLKLTVRAPLGGPERNVVVTRGARVARSPSARMHRIMAQFQAALKTGRSPRLAVQATKDLIDADFLGTDPGKAIGSALNRSANRHPRVAGAALQVLEVVEDKSASLHQRMGEAYFFLHDSEAAARHLGRAVEMWQPDIQGAGFIGNVDARFKNKEMLAKAVWDAGDQTRARAMINDLARTQILSGLLASLELPNPAPRTPFYAQLPPIEPFETRLLDGTAWRLEEHRGRAVVVAFWASWCAPCKREMPELEAMWASRREQPLDLLAVSVDKPTALSKVKRAVAQWGMSFPVAHDPSLGERMQVGGLPAVRLVGPSGSDRYAAKGYSPHGVKALSERVDAILEEIAAGDHLGKGQVVGQLWTRGTASLSGFVGVPGARSVAARPGGAVVGVRGTEPVLLTAQSGVLTGRAEKDVTTRVAGLSGRVAWLSGVVASNPDGWWVRGQAEEDEWFLTLSSPLQDLAVSGPHIWVAMEDGLVVLGAGGSQVARFDASVRDLSADGVGGVWAVDGTTLYRYSIDGMVESSPAPGSWSVASNGRWGGPRVIQLVHGRFGPEGAGRTLAVRQEGTLVGLDAEGEPALSLSLGRPPVIAIQDVDGDGRDELLVVIRGQGVATMKLELP